MSTEEHVNQPEPTRRRGRPRRVIFTEPTELNMNENPVPQQERAKPIPRVSNRRNPMSHARTRQRIPPRNEPVAEQFLTILREVLNQGRPQEPPRPRVEVESKDSMITRFLMFKPPNFDGEPDDRKAEAWLLAVEKIFRVLNCSDVQKVNQATYLLEGTAFHWWEIIERKWEGERIEKTWTPFRKEFLRKFIPQVVKDTREREFMRLIQGSLSVVQYEAEFNRLHIGPQIMTPVSTSKTLAPLYP